MAEPQLDPWLVLRTKSRHEYTVESCLKQKQINVFLPRQNVIRRWKKMKRVQEVALFPGYVFVQPRMDQFENIRFIPGSCGLIFVGDKPAEIPERDLDSVRILIRSGASLLVNPQLTPGQRVEVISGPFMGVQGELIRVKSQDRLVINARLLGSSVSVEVDAENAVTIADPREEGSACIVPRLNTAT